MCLYVYFTTNFMDDMVNITTGAHTHFLICILMACANVLV